MGQRDPRAAHRRGDLGPLSRPASRISTSASRSASCTSRAPCAARPSDDLRIWARTRPPPRAPPRRPPGPHSRRVDIRSAGATGASGLREPQGPRARPAHRQRRARPRPGARALRSAPAATSFAAATGARPPGSGIAIAVQADPAGRSRLRRSGSRAPAGRARCPVAICSPAARHWPAPTQQVSASGRLDPLGAARSAASSACCTTSRSISQTKG